MKVYLTFQRPNRSNAMHKPHSKITKDPVVECAIFLLATILRAHLKFKRKLRDLINETVPNARQVSMSGASTSTASYGEMEGFCDIRRD